MLSKYKDSQIGVKMICSICTLVSLSYLQSRIVELMPIVQAALTVVPQGQADGKIQLNCICLYKRILTSQDVQITPE